MQHWLFATSIEFRRSYAQDVEAIVAFNGLYLERHGNVYLRVLPLLRLGFRDEHYPEFADPRFEVPV